MLQYLAMLDDIKIQKSVQPAKTKGVDIPKEELITAPSSTPQLDDPDDTAANDSKSQKATSHKGTSKVNRFFAKVKALPKRTKIIILTGLVALIAGGTTSAFLLTKPIPEPAPVPAPTYQKPEPPKPTTEPSKLTGLTVPLEVNLRPVLGVMVENSPDARPQSGLKEAGIVFEAIAEGGITRFATLFQDTEAAKIGPVRSVRPYYLDWFAPYQAGIAHAGGSAQALAEIRAQGLRDLDQAANGNQYRRVRERFAPHNLYSDTPRLVELMKSKGFTTSEFTGLTRKEKEEPNTVPTARAIDFRISSPLYNVHYDYDGTTNSYKRSLGGKPHVDEPSGAHLSPKTVVALVIPHSYAGIYSVYQTNGTGKAYIFQDGIVAEATWEKAGRTAQYSFKDATGAVIGLNPGQTWFSVVADTTRVQYTP